MTLDAAALLDTWETGRRLPPLERVLLLLAGAGRQEAASLTIGAKNRALLSLRDDLFGPTMACVVLCPHCATRLEFSLSTAVLLEPAQEVSERPFTVEHEAYLLTIRQPQLRDLQIAGGSGASLYAQCLLEARSGGEAVAVDRLPESARQKVADALQEQDALLNIRLALDCPNCGESWSSPLDILAFLWQEIEQWGERMLRTVHRLASAYGWTEGDILALSAWRRNRYLELLDNG